MVVSRTWMHESEYIEREALADLHAAATQGLVDDLGLRLLSIDGALVSVATHLPGSAIVINRALGIGLDNPATRSTVCEIADAYDGVERYFLQHHPDAIPAELSAWYAEAGLVRARGWQKFSRGREPIRQKTSDLSIRSAGPDDGESFAQIVCDAFDLGDVARPWLARLPSRDGWHIFMSFEGDSPAGAGALFVRDGIGWTDFGATAPAFRRRGSQGAILTRRIQHALDLGCERLFTCTGEAVEGDPQHSYGNIQKVGFKPEYVRENYAPVPPTG